MAAKRGRGRPKSDEERVAYQVTVPKSEADAFDALVRRRGMKAAGNPDALSAASVLRGLMREAVEAERSASAKEVETPTDPVRTAKPKDRP